MEKKLREQVVEILGDDLSEEHIDKICLHNGLTLQVSETVYLYISNSKDTVANILDIQGTTVIRRVKRFIEKATLK